MAGKEPLNQGYASGGTLRPAHAAAAAAIGAVSAAGASLLRVAQLPTTTGPMEVGPSGPGVALWIILGVVPGAVIGLLGPAAAVTAVARGLLVGLLWWATWNLTAMPVLLSRSATWDSAAVARTFPDLVASLLQGAGAGLMWACCCRTSAADGPTAPRPPSQPTSRASSWWAAGSPASR